MYGKDVSESMIALIFQVKLVKVCSQWQWSAAWCPSILLGLNVIAWVINYK